MKKQIVKRANRKIWARQTHIIRIWNLRNKNYHLRKETKRKTIKRLSLCLILKTRWCYQRGSTFFIWRPQSNRLDIVKVTPKINNLLLKPLIERKINLLRRGLKFTLTPKPNTIELKSDIQEFTGTLRLTEFSHSENFDKSQ